MPDNAREIFIKNLRYIMEKKGISQADICRELKIPSATISNWCTGQRYPRINKMQQLADMLGVTYSTLTTENGLQDYEDQQILEALHQDPKLHMLFDRVRNMNERDRDKMIQITEIIKDELYGE